MQDILCPMRRLNGLNCVQMREMSEANEKAEELAGRAKAQEDLSLFEEICWSEETLRELNLEYNERIFEARGGTWVFFGWACAARDSKLAPRSKKNFP